MKWHQKDQQAKQQEWGKPHGDSGKDGPHGGNTDGRPYRCSKENAEGEGTVAVAEPEIVGPEAAAARGARTGQVIEDGPCSDSKRGESRQSRQSSGGQSKVTGGE